MSISIWNYKETTDDSRWHKQKYTDEEIAANAQASSSAPSVAAADVPDPEIGMTMETETEEKEPPPDSDDAETAPASAVPTVTVPSESPSLGAPISSASASASVPDTPVIEVEAEPLALPDSTAPTPDTQTVVFPDAALSHSTSQRSNISSVGASDAPEPSTPGALDDKKDKRRSRLGSLKGFVRRISDQGGSSLSRSNSFGRPGSSLGVKSTSGTGAEGDGTPSRGGSDRGKQR
jgi:hypothetical protein